MMTVGFNWSLPKISLTSTIEVHQKPRVESKNLWGTESNLFLMHHLGQMTNLEL